MNNTTFTDLIAFSGDTYCGTITINDEAGNPVDIASTYDDVILKVYKDGSLLNPKYNYTLTDGLTIADTNKLSFTLTDEQVRKLTNRAFYWRLQVIHKNGHIKSLIAGRFIVSANQHKVEQIEVTT